MECCKRRYLILVDLREVKEIRPGKRSKDFDRFPDDARSYDQKLCFVVLYGQEFKLKTLSLVGKGVRDYLNTDKLKSFLFTCSVSTFHIYFCFAANTQQEYEAWIAGLNYLVQDTQSSTFSLQTERYNIVFN